MNKTIFMRVKISEKKLLGGIILLAAGLFILLNATVVAAPVRISEKGILFAIVACCLMVSGLNLLKRSRLKV